MFLNEIECCNVKLIIRIESGGESGREIEGKNVRKFNGHS